MLNKKFNNRKTDIWFKNHNLIIEADEGNHEIYDSDDEKEREDMFKNHNLRCIIIIFFDVIPMILSLIFLNF